MKVRRPADFEAFLPKPDVMIDDQDVGEWRRLLNVHPSESQGQSVAAYRERLRHVGEMLRLVAASGLSCDGAILAASRLSQVFGRSRTRSRPTMHLEVRLRSRYPARVDAPELEARRPRRRNWIGPHA